MACRHDAIAKRQVFQLERLQQWVVRHEWPRSDEILYMCVKKVLNVRHVNSYDGAEMSGVTSPRPRGSKDKWLDAAYELLIAEGIDAVKVMRLAKRLNLTRTGFYWFFEDISELNHAMVTRWQSKNTGNLVAACQRDAQTVTEALFNVMDCWLNGDLFDAKLDLAIRNWSRNDADLKAHLDQADLARIEAVTSLFRRFGYSCEQAEVRGMTVIYTQIGYISMDMTELRDDRLNRVSHYVEMFASVAPKPEEVNAFLGRNT